VIIRVFTGLATAVVFLFTGCSKKDLPVRTYPLGEKVVLGGLIYSAFETQWLTQMGEEPAPRLPQNRFFLVRVSITNSSSADAMAPAMSIVDDNGNTYQELSNGEGAPQWIGYLRQIRPADTAQGNVIFDAPPRHYKLRVTDDTGERVGLIDIPLSFTAETPEVIHPGDKNAPSDVFKK
jgi:hypothetical protein